MGHAVQRGRNSNVPYKQEPTVWDTGRSSADVIVTITTVVFDNIATVVVSCKTLH